MITVLFSLPPFSLLLEINQFHSAEDKFQDKKKNGERVSFILSKNVKHVEPNKESPTNRNYNCRSL